MAKSLKAARRTSNNLSLQVFSFTKRGESLAKRIARSFPNSKVYRRAELKAGGLKRAVNKAFRKGSKAEALVFISASGIAVRSIAPFIKNKATDPAVVVVDERANFVVSLLSGHLGGANDLTRAFSRELKATPVITTATDIAGLPSIEEIAGRFDLAIDDTRKIKEINAAILAGKPVTIVDADPKRRAAMQEAFGRSGPFVFRARAPEHRRAPTAVVTYKERPTLSRNLPRSALLLRPREFVVGMGCNRGVTIREVREAYASFLRERKLSRDSVRGLATIDIKRNERGLLGFAKSEGLEIDFISTRRLKRVKPPSGPSRAALKYVGVLGVSEGAALLSADAEKLWARKVKKGRVTLAIARAASRS